MPALPADLPHGVAVPRGPAFGDHGVLVFAAEFDFGASHEVALPLRVTGTAAISPSLEAFVLPHLSIGAAFGVVVESSVGAHSFGYGGWPRVGYAFPISRDLVFWPRVGVELSSKSTTFGATTTRTESADLALYAPLALLPLAHIEIGFGPTFTADLVRRQSGGGDAARGTTLGLAIEIGGWL